MSIASRINEIGVHLTKDWRSIEALTGEAEVDKNIENIATVLDNLWEEMPKVTGTGTSLSLNTKKGKMKVNLLGNTSQYTTTGKNLLETKIETATKDGITLTHNADGTYTLNGTATAGTFFQCTQYSKTLPAGTYTFGSSATLPTGLFYSLIQGSGDYIFYTRNGKDTASKTLEEETTYNLIKEYIWIANGITFNNFKLKPQLEKSAVATDYEEYTGGIASPNPSFPQRVEVVSGDNTIVSTGKNLLGLTNGTYSNNGITAIVNNGEITLSGTASGTSFVSIPLLQDIVLLNQTITLSANNISTGGDSLTEIRVYTSGSNYLACTYNTIDNSVVYINKTDTYNRVQIRTSSGVSYNNLVLKPMLEKNNSHTTYEPFTGTSYPIHLGVENLFDKNNIVDDSLYNPDGSINTSYSYFRTDDYIYCHNKQYLTISGCVETGGNVIYYDENKNYVDYFSFKDRTLTIPNNVYYYRFGSRKENKDTLQLEFSSRANSYTPYGTTPIELCKIGNYQDRFIRNSGKNLCDIILDSSVTGDIVYKTYTLKPNTQYTASTNTWVTSSSTANIFISSGTSFRPSSATNGVNGSRTVTSDSNGKITIGYRNVNNSMDYASGNYYVMLNEGETALPYEPYGNGEWYLEKKITKQLVTSSSGSIEANGFRNDGNFSSAYKPATAYPVLYTKYFTYGDTYNSSVNTSGTTLNKLGLNASGQVLCNISGYTTTTQYIDFFNNNDVYLYYPLLTPTYTPITGTLKDELESAWRANSYNGTTNISQVNNDLPFNLSVTALGSE